MDPEEAAERLVSKYGSGRGSLIRILQEIQKTFGYLPREGLEAVSRRLGVPLSEVLNVATFYHQFRLEPLGTYVVQVCFGTACYLRGSPQVYEAMRLAAGLNGGRTTTEDRAITIEKARCFGCCALAPVLMVVSSNGSERYIHGRLNPQEARRLVYAYRQRAAVAAGYGSASAGSPG